jgi:hypothetical protein
MDSECELNHFSPHRPTSEDVPHRCRRCKRDKHPKEFLRTRLPLDEIQNNAWNQPGAKLLSEHRQRS